MSRLSLGGFFFKAFCLSVDVISGWREMRMQQRSKKVKVVIAEAGERKADASLLVTAVAALVRSKSYPFAVQGK